MKRQRWGVGKGLNVNGFTLIELMAVLAILAIILAIAVPSIGKLLAKAEQSADESAIELIENSGENAFVDGEDFDTPTGDGTKGTIPEESYAVPTLVEKGYLKLDPDSKFNAPENYVVKKNKQNDNNPDNDADMTPNTSGEFIYKGVGGADLDDDGGNEPATGVGSVPDQLVCDEAITALGFTCIYTPEEMNAVRTNLAGKYILMNDIDLSEYRAWTPIGTTSTPFRGVLNGNGYKITNLTINQVASEAAGYNHSIYGLFGVMSYGLIENLTLDGFSHTLSGGVDAGALIGFLNNTSSTNSKRVAVGIRNVRLVGDMTHTGEGASGGGMLGSLIGRVNNDYSPLTIDAVYFKGSIVSTSQTVNPETNTVAGLVGSLNTHYAMDVGSSDISIANITLDAIELNGGYIASGLMGQSKALTSNRNLRIANIDISGRIEAGTKVAGLVQLFLSSASRNTDFASDVEISDITMAADLHLRGTGTGVSMQELTISGLIGQVDLLNTRNLTLIQDAVISGSITAVNPGSRLIEMAGVMGLYTSTDSISTTTKPDAVDTFAIENVAVESSIVGEGNAIVGGVFTRYAPNAFVYAGVTIVPKVNHMLHDIALSGNMSGARVSGVADSFTSTGVNLDVSLMNFTATGTMTGSPVSTLFYSYKPGTRTAFTEY